MTIQRVSIADLLVLKASDRLEIDVGEYPVNECPTEIDLIIRRIGSTKPYKTIRYKPSSVTYD